MDGCFKEKRTWLWEGRIDDLLAWMRQEQRRLEVGHAPEAKVLARQINYLESHRHQMDYPRYRARGWPIGSGGIESAVKQFNKRVKGTEQFWNPSQLDAILAMRALWLADDLRWLRHWSTRSAYRRAA